MSAQTKSAIDDALREIQAELRRLAEAAEPFVRHGGTDPAAVTLLASDVLALLDAAAERDALAAKVERVRALPAKHPAGGWYMTSMRDVLAALDEEPQS